MTSILVLVMSDQSYSLSKVSVIMYGSIWVNVKYFSNMIFLRHLVGKLIITHLLFAQLTSVLYYIYLLVFIIVKIAYLNFLCINEDKKNKNITKFRFDLFSRQVPSNT